MMAKFIQRYTRWLHTSWPAGRVERLPAVSAYGATNVPGVYLVGDLTGIPLLKFAADSAVRAVRTIHADPKFQRRARNASRKGGRVHDIVILGAGVSGLAAALEARALGLDFAVVEATEPLSTIVNFPKGKPIFTYPTGMTPAGHLMFSERANTKESLLEELRAQTIQRGITPTRGRAERIVPRGSLLEVVVADGESLLAHRVIVAIGRSGNFRMLGVPGESLEKVVNRLHDPKDYAGKDVLVVGGGDSAVEATIAIAAAGGRVTLSHRGKELSRPKPENLERLRGAASPDAASIRLTLGTRVKSIQADTVTLLHDDQREETLRNDSVLTLIGREAPLDFFRRSGLAIRGEWRTRTWVSFLTFLAFCLTMYHWKSDAFAIKLPGGNPFHQLVKERGWFPYNVTGWFDVLGDGVATAAATPFHLLHTLKLSMADPSFYYTLAYSLCVVVFGIRRIRRRRTPYVAAQTITLMVIQCVPLFILPQILLPWMGRNEWFADGSSLAWLADQFFERYDAIGVERAYWRAYGFILAWPLFVWNVFTDQPLWGWLIVGALQTFVLIPILIHRWGKGAYCGWICSCGALAETLGDAHRDKMPHGPVWNRLNMLGQAILALAFTILIFRVAGWIAPGSWTTRVYDSLAFGLPVVNYKWAVDLMLAGVIGVGGYFWFSGRVWCRFACPLAALMHIYARFSRFRILADKKRCISCNVCTSVCHQGIDVMNFANKGMPMEDPECVRCSACVQSCPTGVLSFGQIDRQTGSILKTDRLAASSVRLVELTIPNSRSPGGRR